MLYLPKGRREVTTKVHLLRKQKGLSPREEQVKNLVLSGMNNASIAYALKLSEKTVKYHLTRIYHVEEVKGRSQLIVKWLSLPKSKEQL